MSAFNPNDLYDLLNRNRPLWLLNIDLSDAVLTGANLQGANLQGANLTGTKLDSANLQGADCAASNFASGSLNFANLQQAILGNATFANAILTNSNLSNANFTNANLSDADLSNANLTGANLTSANLTNAKLLNANLSGANLTGANLTEANLAGANLTNVQGLQTNITVNQQQLSVARQLSFTPPAGFAKGIEKGGPPALAVAADLAVLLANATNSAEGDLKAIMDGVKAINKQKDTLRSIQNLLNQLTKSEATNKPC